ncbi:AAA family ATPase [Stieleria magnilauensis]|uniref:AAA family ATPase n=1 Tax=Stieleria magnilauensis TaxID=2527963 RepID=A0ABX5Y0D0_9BACT|nr:hypothetical protein TBK1r_64470 [Planctomycetes bacterium TBK1r]
MIAQKQIPTDTADRMMREKEECERQRIDEQELSVAMSAAFRPQHGDRETIPAFSETFERITPPYCQSTRCDQVPQSQVAIAVPHDGDSPKFPSPGEVWFVTGKVEDAAKIHSFGYKAIASNMLAFDTKKPGQLVEHVAKIANGASVVLLPNLERHSNSEHTLEQHQERFKTTARKLNDVGVRAVWNDFLLATPEQFNSMALRIVSDLDPSESMPMPEDIETRLAIKEEPVDWLIPGVLVKGKPGFVGGGEKCLKTSISADLAASLASGTKFLGHFPSPVPTRVLFISGESGGKNINDLFRRIKESRNIQSLAGRLHVIDKVIKVDSESGVDHIRRTLKNTGAQVLIVDPLYLCVSGENAENMMIQGQRIQPLADACNDLGVTLLLVHHTKSKSFKGDPYRPAAFTDLAWAGWAAFARQWIMVGRREKYDYEGNHKLWLTIGGNDGHSLVKPVDISEGVYPARRFWKPEVMTTEEADARKRLSDKQRKEAAEYRRDERKTSQKKEAKDRIIEKLSHLGCPSPKSAIGCVRTDTQKTAFAELLDSGVIGSKETEINGRLRTLFFLPQSTPCGLS